MTKKRFESPCRPTVPGPVASARRLTKEKEPLMIPNPRPETVIHKECLVAIKYELLLNYTIGEDVFVCDDGCIWRFSQFLQTIFCFSED